MKKVRTQTKRILSILLAVVMVIAAVPFTFAEDTVDTTVDPPYWGDLTGDGHADIKDMVRINKIRLGKIEGTIEERCFGDLDLDGKLQGTSDGSEEITDSNLIKDMVLINKFRLGKITAFPAETLARITFNPPAKRIYYKGESLNTSGMSVVVENRNNSNVKYTMTENISVTGYNANNTGAQQLTATFRGLTWNFNVTVAAKNHTVTYNYSYNGGTSSTKTSATVAEGAAIDLTPTATKSGWTFVGWNTSSSATTALSSKTMGTSNITLYAVYKKTLTATFIDYSGTTKKTTAKTVDIYNNATSGTVTAPTQNTYTGWTKRGWTTSTTADATPNTNTTFTISSDTTYYGLYQRTLTLSYNANGGNSTPSSQTGTQYANSYSISSTKNPTLKLANAISKSGSTFDGWAMGSSSGTKYAAGANVTISKDTTMYATWKAVPVNIYNFGEETYSFKNFVDCPYTVPDDDPNAFSLYELHSAGHCFGMAVTSSGYYLDKISKSTFGGQNDKALYSYSISKKIKEPICHYLNNQGEDAEFPSMVAGGRLNLDETIDWENLTYGDLKRIAKQDWNDCVEYVKNHAYDNKGNLNIGMYYFDGGHQVNFLYYKEVGGQQRIYAYDNNVPWYEMYYYLGSDGYIHEDSDETFSNELVSLYNAIKGEPIIGFDLMDVNKYFQLAPRFNIKNYIFALEGEIAVEGAKGHRMKCGLGSGNYEMYKIPKGATEVIVKPLVKNASFYYANGEDETTSFGEINEKTYARIDLPPEEIPGFVGGSADKKATIKIYNAPDESVPDTPSTPTEPTTQPDQPSGGCAYCGETHTGFFGMIIGFFHNILALFGLRK